MITWLDGFDWYSAWGDLNMKGYASANLDSASFSAGRFGGQCVSNTYAPLFFRVPSTDTASVGFAIKPSGDRYSSAKFFGFYGNMGQNWMVTVGCTITGMIWVINNNSQTLGTAPSNKTLLNGIWNYIEVEIVRHATAGQVRVYLNGEKIIDVSNVWTGTYPIDTMALWPDSFNSKVDDLYATDQATRIGESRIDTLRVNADTAQKDWTPSTGTSNYACVDDTTFNADTDYNSANTVGAYDLFDLADLSYTPYSIFAVQTVFVARKDNTQARAVKNKIVTGGSTFDGHENFLSMSYQMCFDIYPNNPATSAPWTASDVNNLRLGYQLTT